jgi:hypothetical protein
MWPINTPSWQFIVTWTLICLGTYLSAGLLIIAIRTVRTCAFNWVLLSVCGAFVLAIVYTFQRLPISQLSFNDLMLIHFSRCLGYSILAKSFHATDFSAVLLLNVLFFNLARIQQSLAADGAIACFSSSLVPSA